MGLSRGGTRHPLAILCAGVTPNIGDPWFEAAARVLDIALIEAAPLTRVVQRLERLPSPSPGTAPDVPAVFWLDDWEVHELRFDSLTDLADTGFARMLAHETSDFGV